MHFDIFCFLGFVSLIILVYSEWQRIGGMMVVAGVLLMLSGMWIAIDGIQFMTAVNNVAITNHTIDTFERTEGSCCGCTNATVFSTATLTNGSTLDVLNQTTTYVFSDASYAPYFDMNLLVSLLCILSGMYCVGRGISINLQ